MKRRYVGVILVFVLVIFATKEAKEKSYATSSDSDRIGISPGEIPEAQRIFSAFDRNKNKILKGIEVLDLIHYLGPSLHSNAAFSSENWSLQLSYALQFGVLPFLDESHLAAIRWRHWRWQGGATAEVAVDFEAFKSFYWGLEPYLSKRASEAAK